MQDEFSLLQKSYELFPKLTNIMFGWQYDMAAVEAKVKHVKENDSLRKEDIQMIMDSKEWDYKKFWPDLTTTVTIDKPIDGIFNLGWERRKEAISHLYGRFLHIEVVSVILRFVDPENFAIISPPVEKFFSLQPKEDHVEYYDNYLNLLKKTRNHFHSPEKIADVDMAIWCLSFLLKDWGESDFRARWTESDWSIIELIVLCYKKDRFFKKMRLREVLLQVYQDITEDKCEPNRIFLADCLDSEGIDSELAMIAIAFCFENLLWKLVEEAERTEEFKAIDSRKEWVRRLKGSKIFKTFPIFDRCVTLRNRSVHPWAERLSSVEREEFIDNMEKLIRKKKANAL